MPVTAFRQKSRVLAERFGWALESAEGYVDGERFRRRRRNPPGYLLVGIDGYSIGFRAGYYGRAASAETLSRRAIA